MASDLKVGLQVGGWQYFCQDYYEVESNKGMIRLMSALMLDYILLIQWKDGLVSHCWVDYRELTSSMHCFFFGLLFRW